MTTRNPRKPAFTAPQVSKNKQRMVRLTIPAFRAVLKRQESLGVSRTDIVSDAVMKQLRGSK